MPHEKKVEKLQKLLKEGGSFSLHHYNSNTLRSGKYKKQTLDLSSFNQILDIGHDYAIVEPGVTFAKLCQYTLKKNLIPLVVPEFKGITVGGAIMGASLESSSFKYGQFNDTCLEYEILLGDGTLLLVSSENHPDLFYGLSGSYGTLAILTKIKLRLKQAKKYVELSYKKFSDVSSFLSFFSQHENADFLEGVSLSKDQFLAIKGTLSDETKLPLYRHIFQWFTTHLFEVDHPERMSLKKYLFRFDRGAFWMGYYILSWPLFLRVLSRFRLKSLKISPVNPKKAFFLLAPFFSSNRLYRLWHHVPDNIKERLFFIQDFYTPFSKVSLFLEELKEELNIYPLWFCPVKETSTPQFLSPHYAKEKIMNIGVYGIPQKNVSIPEKTALFEKKICDFGGKKMLYSLTYYDKETFSKVTENSYEALREKFHAEKAFPSLYNKIVTHESEDLHVERPSHP